MISAQVCLNFWTVQITLHASIQRPFEYGRPNYFSELATKKKLCATQNYEIIMNKVLLAT